MAGKEPVKRYKDGAATLSVWANESKTGTWYTFQPQKVYSDDDGKSFKYAGSFNAEDLVKLGGLITQAVKDYPPKKKGK